jgi:hypothetical protein
MASGSNLNLSQINPAKEPFAVFYPEGIVPAVSRPLIGMELMRIPVRFLEYAGQLDQTQLALISMWTIKGEEGDKYTMDEMLTRVYVGEDGRFRGFMYEGVSGVFRYLNKEPGRNTLPNGSRIEVFTSDNDNRAVYVREADWRRVCPVLDQHLTVEYDPAPGSAFESAAAPVGPSSDVGQLTITKRKVQSGKRKGK